MPKIPYNAADLLPTTEEAGKIITAKQSYENALKKPPAERDAWTRKHFNLTPWGIGYNLSKKKYDISASFAVKNNKPIPDKPVNQVLRYLIIAIAIDWTELVSNLKRNLKNWGYTTADLQDIANDVWLAGARPNQIGNTITSAYSLGDSVKLIESVEKHDKLNPKLFTKEGFLKEAVKDKMLEIVKEFTDNLKEQEIKIKVEDILFVGSNASYNYTKDSDIDLHIVTDTSNTKYPKDLANALYSAYRSIFNKAFDISIYGIPLELYIEIEDTPKVSNGIYSVKKDKWVKEPKQEDIPAYDKVSLKKLVDEWEEKCEKVIKDAEADKLDDEVKVLKLIEDIYEKLRKAGLAKGEYHEKNLAFKELRNHGYLDKLKDYRDKLISKRLSLKETFNNDIAKKNFFEELHTLTGSQPVIQGNLFYIYNLKSKNLAKILTWLKSFPFITSVQASENGTYDLSDSNYLALRSAPAQYFDIKGKIL